MVFYRMKRIFLLILLFFALAIALAAHFLSALLAVVLIFAQIFDGDVRRLFGENDVDIAVQTDNDGVDLDFFDALFAHKAVEIRIGEHEVEHHDAALDDGAHDLVRPAFKGDSLGGLDLFAVFVAEDIGDDLVIAVAHFGVESGVLFDERLLFRHVRFEYDLSLIHISEPTRH